MWQPRQELDLLLREFDQGCLDVFLLTGKNTGKASVMSIGSARNAEKY